MTRAALLALILALAPATALAAAGPEAVFVLIAERLALMRPVAQWKHARGTPVEDLEREAVVLDRATADAAAAGLDAASVRPFFRTQIEAAKAIQRCWIGRWRAGEPQPAGEPPDLAADIRPQLIDLGARLTATLAEALTAGGRFDGANAPEFVTTVQTACLDREPRGAIFVALTGVRLSEAPSQ